MKSGELKSSSTDLVNYGFGCKLTSTVVPPPFFFVVVRTAFQMSISQLWTVNGSLGEKEVSLKAKTKDPIAFG